MIHVAEKLYWTAPLDGDCRTPSTTGTRRSRSCQPLGIERHGHKVPPLRINQMSGGCVAWICPRLDQVPPFTRPDSLNNDLRVAKSYLHSIRQQRELPCRRARTPASGDWTSPFSKRVRGCLACLLASDICWSNSRLELA